MLAFHDITLMVAGRTLIEGASATVAAGHKVGVVGRNGTGKSTLFRAITGDLTLETGRIEVPRGARIGGVAQEAPATQDSLLNTVLAADTERAALMAEAETADASANPDRIAEVQTRLADIDAWSAPARAATILAGLGFDETAQARPCADFSGGWRMRVALAGVLFSAPDILLLDEPTNYLDLEGTLWLESYLARYPHTVLIVSHDRQLLNRSVGHILHLSEKRLTLYTGPYDSFDAQRRAQLAQAEAGIKKQEAARAHMQAFVDRFRYKASKAKQAQSRLKMIERMEPIAARLEGAVAGFAFPAPDTLSPPIIKLDGAATGYGDTQVLRSLSLRIDPDDRIALLGANGQGKSTLSKLIADRLPVMEGDVVKSSKLRIGYFAQHQVDELLVDETPLQHLARERPALPPARLRAILAAGGVTAEQADTSVAQLSGGQKARLSMLLATLDAPHVVILDEPTNHLDIESREALVTALMDYPGAVILVSHDPHLIGAVADRLWLVKDGTVRPFDDDLDAYATLLLTSRGSGGVAAKQERREPRRPKAQIRRAVAPLREEAARCEARIEKLQAMRHALDARLADPDLYEPVNRDKLRTLQMKSRELADGLERAETLWLAALEELEAAETAG